MKEWVIERSSGPEFGMNVFLGSIPFSFATKHQFRFCKNGAHGMP